MMKQLAFMSFSGIAGFNRGYQGWSSDGYEEAFVPESPFRTVDVGHGQSTVDLYANKFDEIRDFHDNGDTASLSGVTGVFGNSMNYSSCPLDLSESSLLSIHAKRYDFSGAISYESASIPTALISIDTKRGKQELIGHYSLTGGSAITATGSSSTYKFPHRLLGININVALPPQVIEQPDETAYGQGYEVGMRIAKHITTGDQ